MSSIPSTPIIQNHAETYEKLPSIESGTFEGDFNLMEKGTCLEVEELDQAGNVVATYVASDGVAGYGKRDGIGGGGGGGRIDVVLPKRTNTWAKEVLYAFLPAGYPHSVTSDYMEYQIYDSLQAFSSSIASLLSSRAVLEGVGVGDSDATPTAALLLSILQSSMGRIVTILFAHRFGTALEPECKMYRLSADIFNDAGMIIDCLSPAFPKPTRVMMYSLSSALRALCGVAAGSSKASLSAHFAKWGNLGELNAKDSSQETVISLVGMLAGSVIVSHIHSQFATWSSMIFLLAIHLGTNYLAVRAVSLRTLNRQRANLVFSHYINSTSPTPSSEKQLKKTDPASKFLTPNQVSLSERIFERDGILRGKNGKNLGFCIVGVKLQNILSEMSQQTLNSDSFIQSTIDSKRIISSIQLHGYFLWYTPSKNTYQITFSTNSIVKNQVRAWFHALATAYIIHDSSSILGVEEFMTDGAMRGLRYVRSCRGLIIDGMRDSLGGLDDECVVEDLWEFLDVVGEVVGRFFERFWVGLGEVGWDLETGALETKSGTRVKVLGGEEGL